jgi:Bacterial lipid A biosynthesis acyltransferase
LTRNLKSERLLFAGSQFGLPLASLAALSLIELKIACAFWAIAEVDRKFLQSRGVRTIDIAQQTNRFSFVRLLKNLHADGYAICLVCDAPGKSHARYDFLGYKVNCANLIEMYARLNKCTVIPTYCRLLSGHEVSMHCDLPLMDHENMTQRLLSNVETLIYDDYANYRWNGKSIIFSDPQALLNGLICLPDFLKWRDQAAANDRRKPNKSV